jgi:hypothetical protein
MPLVLTEKSSLVCANQGTVQLTATQSKLAVAGAKVLVTGDLTSAPIRRCTTPTVSGPPPSAPCMTITSVVGGVSTKLKVAGKGVLLQGINGTTDGIVPPLPGIQTWSVQSAGQSKLKAP